MHVVWNNFQCLTRLPLGAVWTEFSCHGIIHFNAQWFRLHAIGVKSRQVRFIHTLYSVHIWYIIHKFDTISIILDVRKAILNRLPYFSGIEGQGVWLHATEVKSRRVHFIQTHCAYLLWNILWFEDIRWTKSNKCNQCNFAFSWASAQSTYRKTHNACYLGQIKTCISLRREP